MKFYLEKKNNIHFQLKFSCDNTWIEKSDGPESHTAVLSATSDKQESYFFTTIKLQIRRTFPHVHFV